jgi:hypothetical protein
VNSATSRPASRAARRLLAAVSVWLIAGCAGSEGSVPDASPAPAPDGSTRDRTPTAIDTSGTETPPADRPVGVDAGAPDAVIGVDASPSQDTSTQCPRPAPDQPWIRGYQDDIVARLSGARALPGGGMLGVRASAAARTATRQFLIDQFRDINLVAQLHDYGSGQNVHALLPATTGTGDHLVFGAHFDTVAGSPGANDNATGVAAVFSTARQLTALPCRSRPVIFVLFDEEEDGLVGSAAFARKLRTDGVRVHSVHTIDQMGWDMDGDRHIELELPDQGLRDIYVAAATDLGWPSSMMSIVTTNVSSTDHASFRPTFPAVGITEEYRSGDTTPHYHRSTDTHATVNLDYLKHTTVLIHHVFGRLVASPN